MEFYRRHRKATITSSLILLLIIVAFFCWWLAVRNKADFQAYEPTALPAGAHITSRTLELWYGEINHPELLLNLSNANITVAEERASTNQEARGTCTGGVNETCQQYKTPHQQTYFVDTVIYNNSTTKTISFTKNATFIWISLAGHNTEAVNNTTDWNKVIDSFRPVSLTGVHAERVHAGP